MSRLTVTEKEHWKQRIERRIDKAIGAIESREPTLMNEVRNQAETKALQSLGILEQFNEVQTLRAKSQELREQADALEENVHVTVLGKPTVDRLGRYSAKCKFDDLKRQHEGLYEEEILKVSKSGGEILKLRSEREALLDTVWLATSNKQIRELWTQVSVVLGEEATPLQEEILSASVDNNA